MAEYSLAEVARIFNLSPARLRYWERTALIAPSPQDDDQPSFGFRDLVCIRTVLALLERGVPLRRIRRSVAAVRERIPEMDRPLGSLRVWLDGSDRVFVYHEGVLVEPDGQLLLDFRLAPESEEDVAPLQLPEPGGCDLQAALEHFERGCRLDTDAATYDEAIEAYTRALEADPTFADAHCNLGTVHFHRGDREMARLCYERAVAHHEEHVEAHYNLANLLEDAGRREAALHHYKAALRGDPLMPDLHLSLALLYEKLGLPRKARDHWRRYLQLSPTGQWADVARQRLDS